MRAALFVAVLGACDLDSSLNAPELSIGGTVHGLWTGAEPVIIRVQADGADTFVSVPANGPFEIPRALDDAAMYAVTVTPPTDHRCTVSGGTGTVSGADVRGVDVACTGPEVMIELSIPLPFRFDASLNAQTIAVSEITQNVSVTVGGDIDSASVDGTQITLEAPSGPRALALGATDVAVAVMAGTLSNTFTLTFDRGSPILEQSTYVKASNTTAGDRFGTSVTVFGDVMVVGAPLESSNADGINPSGQNDESAPRAGAVYVFRRTGAAWAQEAYIKASNSATEDKFGAAVSLHGDRLAVGAPAQGGSGAVYVFRRVAGVWNEEQIVKAPNAEAGDLFGSTVSLFGDRLAVGAVHEDSNADGVGGNQADNSASDCGAAYVFHRNGTVWSIEAYVKAPSSDADDAFAMNLSLSGPADGSADTLAVTDILDDSAATGVQNGTGGATDNNRSNAGAVVVFKRTTTTWAQQAFIKPQTTFNGGNFGCGVTLAGDVLATAACGEDTTGGADAGAIYTYGRTGDTWSFEARLTVANASPNDLLGRSSMALSGELLVVGAAGEDGDQGGVNPPENNNALDSGAVYLFRHTGATWVQDAAFKALDPVAGDRFGGPEGLDGVGGFFGHVVGIAISGDTIVVGASLEDSNATGIDGNAVDTTAADAGAVYIFR